MTHTSVISVVLWDYCVCFGAFNIRHPVWPRWPCHDWSSPGLCPSSTHTLLLTLPLIYNHLEDLSASEALLMTLPLSAPITPSSQTESFTELSWASRYLSHLKFKQWTRAVRFASLSKTSYVGLTMSRQILTIFKAPLSDISNEWILNQMTPVNTNSNSVLHTARRFV